MTRQLDLPISHETRNKLFPKTAYRMVKGKVVALKVLLVTKCDGCGACCRHLGTPPGYAAYYPISGEIADWAKESPDYQRWLNLPPAVEADLREYYRRVQAGELMDRTRDLLNVDELQAEVAAGRLEMAAHLLHKAANPSVAIPCLWFDEETRRCRHYEHRPETCRDAIQPGDPACMATRRAWKVPLPVVGE